MASWLSLRRRRRWAARRCVAARRVDWRTGGARSAHKALPLDAAAAVAEARGRHTLSDAGARAALERGVHTAGPAPQTGLVNSLTAKSIQQIIEAPALVPFERPTNRVVLVGVEGDEVVRDARAAGAAANAPP